MDKEQITAARNRAQQVVDGLAKVRDQQARDVIKLTDYVDVQDAKISELRKIIVELRLKFSEQKCSSNKHYSPFESIFK